MKIKCSKILFIGIILAFIKVPFIPQMVLRGFKLCVSIAALVYIIHVKSISLRQNKILLLFGFCVVLSSYMSYSLGVWFFYGLIYAVLVYEMFVLAMYWIDHYGVKSLVSSVLFVLTVFCFFNDFFVIFNIHFNTYILGNKFGVAYYHLLMLTFLALYLNEQYGNTSCFFVGKIIEVSMSAYCMFIAHLVDTKTGLIGTFCFILLYLLPECIKKILVNAKIAILVMYAFSATILMWNWILSIEFVQNIVVNVLNRSLSLTGRLGIYHILYDIFLRRPFLGWGYESQIVRVENVYGNAQNGLVHLAIQYGLLGVILFTALVYLAFSNVDRSYSGMGVFVAAIYAFFVMATVEIVFSDIFFLLLAVFYAIGSREKTKKKIVFHKRAYLS